MEAALLRQPENAAAPRNVIMIADADRVTVTMLECRLERQGHEILTASNAREVQTLLRLRGPEIDAMVIDDELQGMDPLLLAPRIKQDRSVKRMALIMICRHATPARMKAAAEAGFSHCVDKANLQDMFEPLLDSALADAMARKTIAVDMERQHRAFALLDTSRFYLRTLADAESLSFLMAQAFPEPARAARGLRELLINAVEHGLYGIGYKDKTALLRKGAWREEVDRRAGLQMNAGKAAEAILQRKNDAVFVQITDPGQGFNWSNYLAIDPTRAADGHGRGIAQAYVQAFDDMRYNASGNQVTAAAYFRQENSNVIEW